MPDITMCVNKRCGERFKCYRYMAIPDKYWQSYAAFGEENTHSGCDMFLKIEPEDEIILQDEIITMEEKQNGSESNP